MTGILVNAITLLIGSTVGMVIKSNIKKSITDAIMVGIGFFTVYIGLTGLSSGINAIVYLLAIILGGVIGTALQIEEGIDRLALKIQNKLAKGDEEKRFAEGFSSFFIMSATGAFTIIACFNAGLGDNTMLYTRSVMDLIVSMAMASTFGVGVLFAGIPIILYELILVCFSGALAPVLSDTMIEAISCMGAILTVAIGTNVAGVTKFKVVNYIPALLLAPLFAFLIERI